MANELSTIQNKKPKSLKIAKRGIVTATDFSRVMAVLITDVVEGTISPQTANAAVNAGGKLLKVVEMKYKYGSPNSGDLVLAPQAE